MMNEEMDSLYLRSLTVLLVEDDEDAAEELGVFIGRRVGTVVRAANGLAGLAAFDAHAPQLVVTDIQMPGMDGLAMVEGIRSREPRVPVIVTTAFEKVEYLERAIDLGIDRFVLKPIQAEPLDKALRDCARRLRAEEELKLKEKRDADAVEARQEGCRSLLLTGLAHDFNNLLQAILSAVETAGLMVGPDRAEHALLNVAMASSKEARLLCRRLAMLGGATGTRGQVGPLDALIHQAALEALAGSPLVLETRFAGAEASVQHNEAQLAQVMAGLIDNAREAMPGGGTLSLSTDLCAVTAGDPLGLPPGRYLRVLCQDSGRGIPADELPRVFDPYFSTKPRSRDRGTGLGLALARAVVRAHGGTISIGSEPGRGTRVTLHLPLVEP